MVDLQRFRMILEGSGVHSGSFVKKSYLVILHIGDHWMARVAKGSPEWKVAAFALTGAVIDADIVQWTHATPRSFVATKAESRVGVEFDSGHRWNFLRRKSELCCNWERFCTWTGCIWRTGHK